ncbi:MAG: sialidase family protein [Gemmatimonadaceae bacterium]
MGWTHFTLKNSELYFSRSTDDGSTWSTPRAISSKPGLPRDDNGDLQGFTGAVAPDGTLYVAWAGRYGMEFTLSRDGGKTFTPSRTIIQTGPAYFAIPNFTRGNGFPQLSLAPRTGLRGRLFVTWSDFSNGDFDVFSATSDDEGRTWAGPVRVNDDATHNAKDQFFQWLAVDPTDGSEYVMFYDRRGDSTNVRPTVTIARSSDGGRTFANYAWTRTPFDARHSAFLGDYSGLAAYDGRVYGVWTEEAPTAPAASSGRPRPNTIIRIGVADFGTRAAH